MSDLWTFRSITMLTDSPSDDAIALDLIRAFEPPEVGGKDWNVPRRPGMVVRSRFAKRLLLIADGHVKGIGATEALRWTSFRTACDSLFTVMSMSADPGTVVAYAPYLGLAEDKTLEARCFRVMPGTIHGGANPIQYFRFELECVANPPVWSAVESS